MRSWFAVRENAALSRRAGASLRDGPNAVDGCWKTDFLIVVPFGNLFNSKFTKFIGDERFRSREWPGCQNYA